VLHAKGVQGSGVDHIMRHVSFAEPRFESEASPLRKFVCMITAAGICLAYVANDQRESGVKRKVAAELLESMRSEQIVAYGLAGDFTDEALRFLRYFDVYDHDPARTFEQMAEYKKTNRALFFDGYILCDPSAASATHDSGTRNAKTLTQIAVEQTAEPIELYYNQKSMVLWSKINEDGLKGLMRDVQSVVVDVASRPCSQKCVVQSACQPQVFLE
jgi:hypothetical protein